MWFHVQPGGSGGQKPAASGTLWIGYSQSLPLEGGTSPSDGGVKRSMKVSSVSTGPTSSRTSANACALSPSR